MLHPYMYQYKGVIHTLPTNFTGFNVHFITIHEQIIAT